MSLSETSQAALLVAIFGSVAACSSPSTSTFVVSELIEPDAPAVLMVTAADVAGASPQAQALIGTILEIPPGAVSQATNLQIFATTEAVAPPGAIAAGPVVELEPSPMTFLRPISVTIPVAVPADTSSSLVMVEAVERDGSRSQLQPMSFSSGLVSFETLSFTAFGGIIVPPDGGTTAGSDGGTTAEDGGPLGGQIFLGDAGCAVDARPDSGMFFSGTTIAAYDQLAAPTTIVLGSPAAVCAYPQLPTGAEVLVLTVGSGFLDAGGFFGTAPGCVQGNLPTLTASLVVATSAGLTIDRVPDGGECPAGLLNAGANGTDEIDGDYNLAFPDYCTLFPSRCTSSQGDDEVGIFNAYPLSCVCGP